MILSGGEIHFCFHTSLRLNVKLFTSSESFEMKIRCAKQNDEEHIVKVLMQKMVCLHFVLRQSSCTKEKKLGKLE